MKKLSIISQDEVSENQVIRLRVAKTQQPDAERLISKLYSTCIWMEATAKVLQLKAVKVLLRRRKLLRT